MRDTSSSNYFYNHHARACSETDFWGQVKRSVNGQPVDKGQINMIVSAIVEGLQLGANDFLLDLCCGNGALTTEIVKHCRRGFGVDLSEHLIYIAKKYFEKSGREDYQFGDALEFVSTAKNNQGYDKALCYGSFSYFSRQDSLMFLQNLQIHFPGISRLFVGNLADQDKIHEFYRDDLYEPGIEDDPTSPLGVWWSREAFSQMASEAGWQCIFTKMPEQFYAHHYRFDATMMPA